MPLKILSKSPSQEVHTYDYAKANNAAYSCYDYTPEINVYSCLEQEVKAEQGKQANHAANEQQ